MIKRFLTEEKWSTIAYILNIVGLVMIFTRKSWDTYNPWYGLIGGLLIVLGFSINTYIDLPHPFRQAETSKKFGIIFRICAIIVLIILLIYTIFEEQAELSLNM